METLSLKALSFNVLQGNSQGNFLETGSKNIGNFGSKKEAKVSSQKGLEDKLRLVSKDDYNSQEVGKMSLDDFCKTGMVLKVSSALLGETILFAANDRAARQFTGAGGMVIYTGAELQTLLASGAMGEDLRKIHEAKQIFNGRF